MWVLSSRGKALVAGALKKEAVFFVKNNSECHSPFKTPCSYCTLVSERQHLVLIVPCCQSVSTLFLLYLVVRASASCSYCTLVSERQHLIKQIILKAGFRKLTSNISMYYFVFSFNTNVIS